MKHKPKRVSSAAPLTLQKYNEDFTCLGAHGRYDEREMKAESKTTNVPLNLSVREPVALAIKGHIAGKRRKGEPTLSELTETLWIDYMTKNGVKLSPVIKRGTHQ